MAEVLYHIERPTPRARYIVQHVLVNIVGVEAVELPVLRSDASLDRPLVHYGHQRIDGAFNIIPSEGLEWAVGRTDDPECVNGGIPMLFPVLGGDLPFDIFAASFFLLARMEELGPLAVDEHGRPRTADMLGARKGWLHRSLVDEWGVMLAKAWSLRDPRLRIPARRYRHLVTMDVDNGFRYLGREGWRSVGAAVRDLFRGRPDLVADRIRTLAGKRSDPYDVYDEFRALAEVGADRVIVNFLVAPRGTRDHAVGLRSGLMRQRIKEIAEWAEIGIHPSYDSSVKSGRTGREMTTLAGVVNGPITCSRQHFLRMKLPDTYHELEALGIREDHSMGFSDSLGFRAGTCTPFRYYDAVAERETGLTVVPFAVMDSAMAYKLGSTPEEAVHQATAVVDAVRKVGGTFSAIWHERFLSDYDTEQGWKQAITSIIEAARS